MNYMTFIWLYPGIKWWFIIIYHDLYKLFCSIFLRISRWLYLFDIDYMSRLDSENNVGPAVFVQSVAPTGWPCHSACRNCPWRARSFFLNGNIIYTCRFFMVFPECVARVPVSLWGSGGWGCVRSTLRSRAQPFATVRNRSRDPRMAVPMGSSAEVVIFGGFRRVVASFRVAGAILLRRFQKMCCSFRGRRSTLGVSIVIFRGRRSTLDVSRCVFFANRIGRAASSGDKVQIPWQAWHFVRCAENWRKPRTKHRFWCCQFSGSKENS